MQEPTGNGKGNDKGSKKAKTSDSAHTQDAISTSQSALY